MYGEQIRKLRAEKNMTQADLAKALEMKDKESTLRMWELGKSQPNIDKLIQIADYFGVTVDYILGRKSESERVNLSEFEKEIREGVNRIAYNDLLFKIQSYILELQLISPKDTFLKIEMIRRFMDALDEIIVLSDEDEEVRAPAKFVSKSSNIIDTSEFITSVLLESWDSFEKKIGEITSAIRKSTLQRYLNRKKNEYA
jgi:transcriptional regulator with XRE-family HTH domain